MTRRSFLAKSATASAFVGGESLFRQPGSPELDQQSRDYYELWIYHVRRGRQHELLSEFFRKAWLPAMNRIGIAPIGAFEVMVGPENPSIYLLLPFKSLDLLATLEARLAADSEYQTTGAAVINAPATDPAYTRAESSLMLAFEAMPHLRPPDFGARQPDRVFELRIYESHSKKANAKKIEMFNTGEIGIFRRTGLQPVFFGETLIGQKLPQLTYMLVFDSMASHDKNWGTFTADPEWRKLSTTPGYSDGEIVSNISNVFLRPTTYSQI